MDLLPIDPDALVVSRPWRITAEMADLLFVVVSEIEVFGTANPLDIELTVGPYYRSMRMIGVPYRPTEWFRPLSSTERRRYSRAARRLEWFGYFDRVLADGRDRVTHIRPLYDTLAWVIDNADSVDLAHLAEGLRRCEWAGNLYEQFRRNHGEIE